MQMMSFGVMKTPALVLNDKVKASGRISSVEDIKGLLKKYLICVYIGSLFINRLLIFLFNLNNTKKFLKIKIKKHCNIKKN